MNHKQGEKVHALKRFKERLGVDLTGPDYIKLCADCGDRTKSKFVCFEDNNRQIIELARFGFVFYVVYDVKLRRVVTILPNGIRRSFKLNPISII